VDEKFQGLTLEKDLHKLAARGQDPSFSRHGRA